MRVSTLALPLALALAVTGCGRFGSASNSSASGWNPMGWFGGESAPETLEPKGGYPDAKDDSRVPVPHILSAGFEPLNEGRLLLVRAIAPTKGWHDVELITERPQPTGQLRPDDDGVLRLVLVGNPPPADSADARRPANPAVDTLNVALPISTTKLERILAIEIRAADRITVLRK